MNEDQNWREPTEEEREMLYQHLVQQHGLTHEEASNSLEIASMVVLENFVSTSPGYTGRILIVIYGYPESLEAYQFMEFDEDAHQDTELRRFIAG